MASEVDLSEEIKGDEERMVADEEQVKKNKFMSYFTRSDGNKNSVREKETMLKRKRELKEDIASPSESGSDSGISDRAKGGSKKARAGTGGSKAAMYSRSKQVPLASPTLTFRASPKPF